MAKANAHEEAVNSGIKANEEIASIIERMGNSNAPNGVILTTYQQGQRALIQALGESDPQQATHEVMSEMRSSLRRRFDDLYRTSQTFGEDEAFRQLRLYQDKVRRRGKGIDLSEQLSTAKKATLARFDNQAATIETLVMTNATEEEIIGDEDKAGILRPSDLLITGAFYIALLLWDSFGNYVTNYGTLDYQKQVVAALDLRTTLCCIHAHAQIKPFERPFETLYPPAYAGEQDAPPFHYWCRSAMVLYSPQFETGITQQMLDGAQMILAELAAGGVKFRHPVDAFG